MDLRYIFYDNTNHNFLHISPSSSILQNNTYIVLFQPYEKRTTVIRIKKSGILLSNYLFLIIFVLEYARHLLWLWHGLCI